MGELVVDIALLMVAYDTYRLRRYLTDVLQVDVWWYIGSRVDSGPASLPTLDAPINGNSVVPWRYYFNTGTLIFIFIEPHD